MYYHNRGDPAFARTYISSMLGIGNDIFRGFYMGSDGFCPTRTFFTKNPAMQNILEVQRQWYMNMLWGRLSYNPKTSDEVFKKYMALKYPTVSSEKLFNAWGKASSCIPKITELVQGSWTIDLNWWIEGCLSKAGFRTIKHFSECKVARGSSLCSISETAKDSCNTNKNSYQLADEIEIDAKASLATIKNMKATPNTELSETINNIKAMSYMSIYYAYKIRGATYLKANKLDEAKKVMGKAYGWWMTYANLMDSMYTGMGMQRVRNLSNWRELDQAVLKEYTDLGGIGIPQIEMDGK
jgi:hypothetical protein